MANTGEFCILLDRGADAGELAARLAAHADAHLDLKNLDARVTWPGLDDVGAAAPPPDPRMRPAAVITGSCDRLTPQNAKDLLGPNWQGAASRYKVRAFYVVDSTYGDNWEEVLCR